MIFRETASACALPAPFKPKRCFRFPLTKFPGPGFSHRFFNLGDEAARNTLQEKGECGWRVQENGRTSTGTQGG